MKRFFLSLVFPFAASAQFAPGAGQPGTTAVHKDSSAIVGWASGCKVVRGLQDISNNASGAASFGDSTSAIGVADYPNVVSLGDGGYAILTFPSPIKNEPGPDFCVFENSFDPGFLELAFVEVSSDGVNYVRFPATSNQQNIVQVGPFDTSGDPAKLNNLAGKYIANYGVPFDLQELQDMPALDVNNITHVKIIDVVGCIQPQYATYDKNNNIINDLWPTAFPSGGFDLDAVGVIHQQPLGIEVENEKTGIFIYPSPFSRQMFVVVESETVFELRDVFGKIAITTTLKNGTNEIQVESLLPGIYFAFVKGEKIPAKKIVKVE